MKGFHIEVTVQPAQSPDLNTNDLAFFASLQKDTDLVAKENVKDLIAAVKLCLDEYHSEGMDAVCAAFLRVTTVSSRRWETTITAIIPAVEQLTAGQSEQVMRTTGQCL